MSTTDPTKQASKNLTKLLTKLSAAGKPAAAGHPAPVPAPTDQEPRPDPVLDQLVFSMCLWESATDHAMALAARVQSVFVDLNELRVAFADEVAAALGDTSPQAAERAARLQSALNEIYERHHTLSLADLPTMGKREARAYIESIDALPQFVGARLLLLCCEVPAMPVDERLRSALAAERIIEADATIESAAHLLEKLIPSDQFAATSLLLQSWCDAKSSRGAKKSGTAKPKATKPRAAKPAKEHVPKAPKSAKSADRPARSRTKASG